MLFSVVWVIGIYLNGIGQQQAQRDAYEQQLIQQQQAQQELLNIQPIEINGTSWATITITDSSTWTVINSGDSIEDIIVE